MLDEFITHTLGEAARRHYRIIIDDAAEVARLMKKAMPQVKENRRDTGDAYSFNWSMRIAPDLQVPFEPSHENMANLKLYRISRLRFWRRICGAPSPVLSREREGGRDTRH